MRHRRHDIVVETPDARLRGLLSRPARASGIVVIGQASGERPIGARHLRVAEGLRDAGLATLLVDLLTAEENRVDHSTGVPRFDIPHLAERVVGAIDWVAGMEEAEGLDLGCFGADTGAAAALVAASERPDVVRAVVSRGGRPDLAGPWLANVRAPTLLIAGSRDEIVAGLNRRALDSLRCEKRLVIVPGATHLFEEPGAFARVVELATEWFLARLGARPGATAPARS